MLSMQGMMKKSPGPCEPPRFTRPSRKITARWYSCAHSFGQYWGSVTFWCGSGSNSGSADPTTDPTPDSTPFFIDLRMQKNIYFLHIFSYNLPTRTSSSSKKLNFFAKICVKILFCRHYFSSLNTFMRKGKDPDPDPHL
jgi:hypothetical protein